MFEEGGRKGDIVLPTTEFRQKFHTFGRGAITGGESDNSGSSICHFPIYQNAQAYSPEKKHTGS